MERSIPQMRKISGILFDENTCKTFLIEKGVFLREYPCPLCYKSMNLHLTSSRYRCSKGHVEKQVSLYINSFFSTSKIKCNEAMEIAYYWLIGAKYSSIIHATHHSSQTITAYINHLNHLVASSLTEQSTIIGGPGIVIEIDESKISRRKNNRGHRVEGAWVVGAIERTPEKKLFIIEVKDRSTNTLKQIIEQHVLVGTTILSDCWKGYCFLDKSITNQVPTYDHQTVNHSLYFKDPITQVHTNGIEGTWAGLKAAIPKKNRSSNTLNHNLLSYIWKRKNKNRLWEAFLEALSDVGYPI